MRFIFALFLLSAFLSPVSAHAQCTMPDGKPDAEAGVIVFNTDHKVMQYCNGDRWIGLWGGGEQGDGLPTCGNGEIVQYASGEWGCNDGSGLTNLNASNLIFGTVPSDRLGSGTANNTTFLRGDGTWAEPSGGGSLTGQLDAQNGYAWVGGLLMQFGVVCPSGGTTQTYSYPIAFPTKALQIIGTRDTAHHGATRANFHVQLSNNSTFTAGQAGMSGCTNWLAIGY